MNLNIKGVGTDIIEIKRIKEAIDRKGDDFINKIFTKIEIEYSNRHKDPLPHLAARFAAKEAIVKAFGNGFGKLSFHDIEILNNKKGKPLANIKAEILKEFDISNIEISLSHSKE